MFGNLWEPLPGDLWNLAWEPCLGTWLGNVAWEPPANLALGTLLGNLAWEPLPWNLATLGIRIWLLRPAPGPLLWLKTPGLRVAEKSALKTMVGEPQGSRAGGPSFLLLEPDTVHNHPFVHLAWQSNLSWYAFGSGKGLTA